MIIICLRQNQHRHLNHDHHHHQNHTVIISIIKIIRISIIISIIIIPMIVIIMQKEWGVDSSSKKWSICQFAVNYFLIWLKIRSAKLPKFAKRNVQLLEVIVIAKYIPSGVPLNYGKIFNNQPVYRTSIFFLISNIIQVRQRDAQSTTLMLVVVIGVFLCTEIPLMVITALHTLSNRF